MNTQEQPKHTLGEWSTDGKEIRGGLKTIGSPLGINKIAIINQGGLSSPGGDPKANAERIVKCVNGYDTLLNQLRYMLSQAELACIFHGNKPDTNDDIIKCRKIIEQAK